MMLPGHAGEVSSLAFSPDGKRIVTAGQIVKIWDAATLLQVIIFVGAPFSAVRCRGCLAGISRMCCCNCSEERLGLQELTLPGHSAAVASVGFSRDGKWVVSGSDDKLVKIWDTATFKEVCPLCGGRFGCGAQEGECRS